MESYSVGGDNGLDDGRRIDQRDDGETGKVRMTERTTRSLCGSSKEEFWKRKRHGDGTLQEWGSIRVLNEEWTKSRDESTEESSVEISRIYFIEGVRDGRILYSDGF